MKKTAKRKKVSGFCAGMIAVALLITEAVPVQLAAQQDEIQGADFDFSAGTDAEVVTEEERGDYVILAEDGADLPLGEPQTVQEFSCQLQDVVFEADLSADQLLELEQTENITVEENFFLFGAGTEYPQGGGDASAEIMTSDSGQETSDIDWNYRMIRAEDIICQTENLHPVKVAVLDSGIELLSGIPVYASVNLVIEEQDLPYYMNDMVGHGTAVADIIHTIAPEAQICSVRVLDRENKGRLSDVVEGIYWCIEQDVDIINMSFGTSTQSEILKKAVQDAAEHGILIVGAAGNGGSGAAVEYPAAFEEVVAVGAVDTAANKTEESATGREVELAAPGEQILTKSVFGMETVNSGTSMAAPHVAGAAAALMGLDEKKSAKEIRYLLDQCGNPLGEREAYGYGMIDLEYAVSLLENDVCLSEESASEGRTAAIGMTQREEVETFEEVAYVEGRWGPDNHVKLMEEGINTVGSFDETEIKLLKAGAVHPDKNEAIRGGHFPEWHGHAEAKYGTYDTNYISNYIFATKIALVNGNTADLQPVKGMAQQCYDRMMGVVSTTGIGDVSWKTIISSTAGLDYAGQSAATKKKWRRTYLYGMAVHIITDVFAHNCYYETPDGEMIYLDHSGNGWADNAKFPYPQDTNQFYSNRFICAGKVAFQATARCKAGKAGKPIDFYPKGYEDSYWKGFFIFRIYEYAVQVDPDGKYMNNLGLISIDNACEKFN